jgi:hypothetical protein
MMVETEIPRLALLDSAALPMGPHEDPSTAIDHDTPFHAQGHAICLNRSVQSLKSLA